MIYKLFCYYSTWIQCMYIFYYFMYNQFLYLPNLLLSVGFMAYLYIHISIKKIKFETTFLSVNILLHVLPLIHMLISKNIVLGLRELCITFPLYLVYIYYMNTTMCDIYIKSKQVTSFQELCDMV